MAVCGPTASGKSELSDTLADRLTREHGTWAPTIVVDSMQVYAEIPEITNQRRRREASLTGIVSVTRGWTVADHRRRAEDLIRRCRAPFVLDAGTGMYLNAIILDVPLAPKVPDEIRRRALVLAQDAENPRRAAREKELELAGVRERGSIWDGQLRYDVRLIYLRPARPFLDAAVARRSSEIARKGIPEAEALKKLQDSGARINASVRDSIGVREMMAHVRGEISLEEAERIIDRRTRRLARRQMRWFDKLARTLEGRAGTLVVERADDPAIANCMHDIIGT